MEGCGDGIMRVRHVRKWCRYFGAGRPDIRDDYGNGRPSTYRAEVNGAQVEKLILEDRRVTIPDLSASSEKYTTLFKKNFYIAKCMHAGYRDI
jgi:hypothetical protein